MRNFVRFFIILAAASLSACTQALESVTLNSDEVSNPTAKFQYASQTIAEGSSALTVTVVLDFASPQDITIPLTRSGTGVEGVNYSLSSTNLSIASGQTSGSITLTPIKDSVYGSTKTAILTMGTAANVNLGTFSSYTLTMSEADSMPSITVATASVNKGQTFTYTATLSEACESVVSANWTTSDGTAIAGVNYQADAGMILFTPGVTSTTFTVDTITSNGYQVDPTLTFDVALSGASGATLAQSQVTSSILETLSSASANLTFNDHTIYTDAYDYGWLPSTSGMSQTSSSTTQVHGGTKSIKATCTAASGGLCSGKAMSFLHSPIRAKPFSSISFWIYPEVTTPAQTSFFVQSRVGNIYTKYTYTTPTAGMWTNVVIPLSNFVPSVDSEIQTLYIGATVPLNSAYYIDDVKLVAGANIPNYVNTTVDGATVINTLDESKRGGNLVYWTHQIKSVPTFVTKLNDAKINVMRFNGSLADQYDWSLHKYLAGATADNSNLGSWSLLNTATSATAGDFLLKVEEIGGEGHITVNYGSGTPEQAAAWVAWANGDVNDTFSLGTDSKGRDWQTVGYWAQLRAAAPLGVNDGYNHLRLSHPAPFNNKYWEIGNEVYGTAWEIDQHGAAGSGLPGISHDGYTYGTIAADYFVKMKAVDPNIYVGLVGNTPDDNNEDAHGGYSSVAVTNPRTGVSSSGFNPATMKYFYDTAGQAPDFVVYHHYPLTGGAPGTSSEDDYGSLSTPTTKFKPRIEKLKQMIVDYMNQPTNNSVKIAVTEMDAAARLPGKQSMSLVMSLWVADMIGVSSMDPKISNLIYWSFFEDVTNTGVSLGNSFYGTQLYGGHSMFFKAFAGDWTGVTPSMTVGDPLAAYYGYKFLSRWANVGDTILQSSTDSHFLSVYPARLANGDLAVLMINKYPSADLFHNITLNGLTADAQGTLYVYGKDQDAVRSDPVSVSVRGDQQLTFKLPPYSLSLLIIPAQ